MQCNPPLLAGHDAINEKNIYTEPSCCTGTSTGISAHDRALTARALAAPVGVHAQDFSRPGHMVPLRARPGGVLTRRGHTEAAVDLCALAGLPRAGLLCELVNDDEIGSMMRRDACRAFADRFGLPMISVAMLADYRERKEGISVPKAQL